MPNIFTTMHPFVNNSPRYSTSFHLLEMSILHVIFRWVEIDNSKLQIIAYLFIVKNWLKMDHEHVIIQYIEDIYLFEVNTKYISSSVLKTSEFS